MTPAEWAAVKENVFPAARPFIEEVPDRHWHRDAGGTCDSSVPHSSQALALEVFGTIWSLPERNEIFSALARRLHLPDSTSWDLVPEYEVDRNLLNEPRPTQLDFLVRGDSQVIAVECKFTEADGGACSQPKSRKAPNGVVRPRQCDGSYSMQSVPGTSLVARCALTAKGVDYWKWIPRVFTDCSAEVDQVPCPFSGPSYQWMRNLVAVSALGEREGKSPAFVVVYADGVDGSPLPMALKVRTQEWRDFVGSVRENLPFHSISYLEVIELASEHSRPASATVLADLRRWITDKYMHAARRGRKQSTTSG